MRIQFGELVGKTLVSIEGGVGDDRVVMVCDDGTVYTMCHLQDCCESVEVEDIAGDLSDLVGSPVLRAEEDTNNDDRPRDYAESWTWTFYRIATAKGAVVIRWLGESNGYYSESVDLFKESPDA